MNVVILSIFCIFYKAFDVCIKFWSGYRTKSINDLVRVYGILQGPFHVDCSYPRKVIIYATNIGNLGFHNIG